MCGALDYVVGLFLGKRIDKKPYVIYYMNHTLNEPQVNYTVTKKEFLEVVFGFEKFRPCLIESHVIFFTYHAPLKHLVEKKGTKPILIRWIMLLQKFDCKNKDREGSDNL